VEYRVDELAREAGTTVRNIRAYQDRGLLPPPRREGRAGVYTAVHLARLRLIGQLLERGYTLANIAELLSTWEAGHDLGTVLGLEQAVSGPWSDEAATYLTAEEVADLFSGDTDPDSVAAAISMGYLVPEGDRFRVPSPRLLHAGSELFRAGVPMDAIFEHGRALRSDVDRIAKRFVQLFEDHVFGDTHGAPDPDLPHTAELVRRLRPLAEMAVDAELARAMQHHATEMLGTQLTELLGAEEQGTETA
jgi:DNA-binding transcriptional MerR regulator